MKRAISIVLCLLGIGLVVVLSGSLSRAAVPASWKAVILPGGNLSGDALRSDGSGWVYDDAEPSVDVYATIGTSGKNYRTIFHMNIFSPEKLFFSDINFIPVSTGSSDTYPGFPTGPLYEFINGQHPYNEYLAIQFGFFGEYTKNKELADWTKMEIGGAKMPMRMYVSIDSKNLQGDCSECDPTNYHSIEINSFDAELERTGISDWTIHVDTHFDQIPLDESLTYPPGYSSYEFIAEKYCTCVTQTVRKKTISTKVVNYATWGTARIAFDIKFVMN
ncbi:MAG: hypothetical protein IH583_15720 [Candidatus Aminicenantes bacterium]|nr:hypothetical protein [Candidatus Aminicenantes bacterium]